MNYPNQEQENTGYGDLTNSTRQGNFEDGYRENPYDRYNQFDNAWTDTSVNPNPMNQQELEIGGWDET